MEEEKRLHPRFQPDGLTANISIEPPPPGQTLYLEGTVMDMSYSGIKIKLNAPINIEIPESTILINITLPESKVPLSIRGTIKHLNDATEYGLQYTVNNLEQKMDKLMFECIKLAPQQRLTRD